MHGVAFRDQAEVAAHGVRAGMQSADLGDDQALAHVLHEFIQALRAGLEEEIARGHAHRRRIPGFARTAGGFHAGLAGRLEVIKERLEDTVLHHIQRAAGHALIVEGTALKAALEQRVVDQGDHIRGDLFALAACEKTHILLGILRGENAGENPEQIAHGIGIENGAVHAALDWLGAEHEERLFSRFLRRSHSLFLPECAAHAHRALPGALSVVPGQGIDIADKDIVPHLQVQAVGIDNAHRAGGGGDHIVGRGGNPRIAREQRLLRLADVIELFLRRHAVQFRCIVVYVRILRVPGIDFLHAVILGEGGRLDDARNQLGNGFVVKGLRPGIAHPAVVDAAQAQTAGAVDGIVVDHALLAHGAEAVTGGKVDFGCGNARLGGCRKELSDIFVHDSSSFTSRRRR